MEKIVVPNGSSLRQRPSLGDNGGNGGIYLTLVAMKIFPRAKNIQLVDDKDFRRVFLDGSYFSLMELFGRKKKQAGRLLRRCWPGTL